MVARGREERAVALTAVDFQLRLLEREVIRQRVGRFGLAEHEVAAVPQGEGEELEGAFLEFGREVDEHIAAEFEVDAREGRALAEVVLAEDGQHADLLLDLVIAVLRGEIAFDEVGRQIDERRRRVNPPPGERDRVVVQVGGEDADVEGGQLLPEHIAEQDRQRVRLLARRAARRPEAQLIVVLPRVFDQRRQDALPQVGEEIGVAEELGHFDQEAADQPLVFVRVPLQEADIVGQSDGAGGDHPPLQPPHDRRRLVTVEVDAAAHAQLLEEGAQRALLGRADRLLGARQEVGEDRADMLDVRDDVDRCRRERARHGGVGGGLRVLDDHRAAHRAHLARARRAVRAAAGEDDGDQPLPVCRRRAAQQAVHRGGRPVRGVRVDAHMAVEDLDVSIGRDDEDHAGLEGRLILDRADGQFPPAAEDLAEMAHPRRVDVLGDDDRRGEVGGQRADERRERLDPPRR